MPRRKTPAAVRPFPPSPADEELLESASYRAGQTLPASWSPEAYLRWFSTFLRTDFSTLTPGQLHGMRVDAEAFARLELVTASSIGELPDLALLETLQRDVQQGIQRLRDGEWFLLEEGIGYGIAQIGDHIMKGCRRGTFEDAFRASAMDVVEAFWDRLPVCPRCRTTFLKIGKQKYCSPICASRAHWEAFKTRHRVRNHHREYKRRVQKRLGAKVTIKPRRRT